MSKPTARHVGLGATQIVFSLLVCGFLFLPMVVVIILAFSSAENMTFPPPGFSFQWFQEFSTSLDFIDSLFTSLTVAGMSAIIAVLVGVPGALWVSRTEGRVGKLLEAFLLSPLFIATIALGLLLSRFYDLVGIPNSLFTIAFGHSLLGTAYVGRLSLASLRQVGLSPERAVRSLGCSPMKAILQVTLPSARAGIAAGCIFSLLVSLDDINIALFLSNIETTTLPVRIFSYLEQNSDPFAAAVSTILVGIAFALLFIADRLVGLDQLFGVRR